MRNVMRRAGCYIPLIFISLIFWSAFSGCRRRPDGVLTDKEMERLLTDIFLADALSQSTSSGVIPDSIRSTLEERVMLQHGIDRQMLDSTLLWYAKNMDDYYKVYQKVAKNLEKERSRLTGLEDNAQSMANNIWSLPAYLTFSPLGSYGSFVFEMPGDVLEKGERLEWRMRMQRGHEAEVILGIDYTDGSTTTLWRKVVGEKTQNLAFISDTTRVPERIFGQIYMAKTELPTFIDSLALFKLPFDSTAYQNKWSQRTIHGPRPHPVEKKETILRSDSLSNERTLHY